MVFDYPRRRFHNEFANFRHHSFEEPLLPIDYENAFFDLQTECYYGENSYTSDDVLDDDFSLISGSAGIYDNASWLKFDNDMEDRREARENMFSKYDNMMAYHRKCELEDIIMKDEIRSQSTLNNLQHVYTGRSTLYCPAGAFLVMPNGQVHLTPPRKSIPTIDVSVPSGYQNASPLTPRQIEHETLKNQWCSRRNLSPCFADSDIRVRSSPEKHFQKVEKPLSWSSPMDCQTPVCPNDDELIPLIEKTLIKVRNVHPAACLHELHAQSRELFPNKPIFDMRKLATGKQKKGAFEVVCKFEFNGARLYTHHTERTKSDAKMNASRNMLRKLNSIPNLTIFLDDQRISSGAYSSFEHPRCQLLHLHDTNPTKYPLSPTFQPSVWRTLPRNRYKARCFNMLCHFQVDGEKLVTIGAAISKKQAIVQAARNMLKRLFPHVESVKDSQAENEPASEPMKSPWTCHFCKSFMTGRKPFLSHLTGRSHIQRMSELELNAEEENKILLAAAEEALKKKEELKRNMELKSSNQRDSAKLQSNKNDRFYHDKIAMNSSKKDSPDSEGTCKNVSTDRS